MVNDYFYVQLLQSLGVVLPLECTQEVMLLERGEICPIPGVASALIGVVNQRGRMLWVLDLSDLLGLSLSPSGRLSRTKTQDSLTTLLITPNSNKAALGTTQPTLACVVAIKRVVSLNPATFKAVPTRLSPALKRFFTGVVKIENSVVAVLNVNAIFKYLQ